MLYFTDNAENWLLALEATKRDEDITLITRKHIEETLGYSVAEAHGSTTLAKCLRRERPVGTVLRRRIRDAYKVQDAEIVQYLSAQPTYLAASLDDFQAWDWPREPLGRGIAYRLDVALDGILANGLGIQDRRRIFAPHERGERILPLTADLFRVVVHKPGRKPERILGYWLAVPLTERRFEDALDGRFSLANVKERDIAPTFGGGKIDVYCDAFVRAVEAANDHRRGEIARILSDSLVKTVLAHCTDKNLFINRICAYAWNGDREVAIRQRVTPVQLCEHFGLKRNGEKRDADGNPAYKGDWKSILESKAFANFGAKNNENQQLLTAGKKAYKRACPRSKVENERFR